MTELTNTTRKEKAIKVSSNELKKKVLNYKYASGATEELVIEYDGKKLVVRQEITPQIIF